MTRSWRRILALAALAACLGAGRAAAQGADARFLADTRSYFGKLEKLGFAGVVLVAKDGAPLLAEGYGLADREHGVRWSPGTVSCLGSLTKQFTAAAILHLEQDGKLRVQDPITRYFDGVPADKQAITLHQLLTHSSGIADLEGADDYDPIGREEFIRRALAQPLAFPPGTGYQYSNAGYSLLGAILEKVSGLPYERFLRERLFLPLGMYETGYVLPAWGAGRIAQGYTAQGPWGTVLGHPLDHPIEKTDGPYWVLRANGGIHSTVYDMLRWTTALLDGRALPAEARERAWTPHVPEPGGTSYGYGWSIAEVPGGPAGKLKVVTHNGSNGIFFADLAILPAERLVVFLQTNVRSELPMTGEILHTVGRRLLGQPYPELPDVVEALAADLAALAGTYRLEGSGNAVEVKADGGALLITPQGRTAFARLQSTRRLDAAALARSERLSRRMDEIAAAFVKRDFAPLAAAYGGTVPVERLREAWSQRLEELEKENGVLAGHEVLGTALQEERDVTVVRLRFAHGSVDRAFVWDKEQEERLEGISQRGLDPQARCLPVRGGGFATWSPATGGSSPVRFETEAGGHVRLHFGSGETGFAAVK